MHVPYVSDYQIYQGATCLRSCLIVLLYIDIFILGMDCETEIDECLSVPCQNMASCDDFVGYYVCTCVPGYTG